MYSLIPYYIKINIDTLDLFFTTENMFISKRQENGEYMINLDNYRVCTLNVFEKDTLGKLLFSKKFYPRQVPLEVNFCGKNVGKITDRDLRNPRLSATVDNFGISLRYKLKEFTLQYIKDGVLIENFVQGSIIGEDQVSELLKLEDSNPIIFKDIKVDLNGMEVPIYKPSVFYTSK